MRGLTLGIISSGGSAAVPFVPNAFSFTDQTDVEMAATGTSAGVQITPSVAGGDAPISISGGEYQTADDSGFTTNASSWSSSPGTIAANQYVRVRHTTADNWLTGASCTLTVGEAGQEQTDTFNTTTRDATYLYLTATSGNWPIPSNWYPGRNSVEGIGGGGSWNSPSPLAGGGGGAYAIAENFPLTAPGTVPYSMGIGADTVFGAVLVAKAGAASGSGGTGGQAPACTPSSGAISGGNTPGSPAGGSRGWPGGNAAGPTGLLTGWTLPSVAGAGAGGAAGFGAPSGPAAFPGSPGSPYGGGGGGRGINPFGGAGTPGGAGAPGILRLRY